MGQRPEVRVLVDAAVEGDRHADGDLGLEQRVLGIDPLHALYLQRDEIPVDRDATVKQRDELLQHGLHGVVCVVAYEYNEGDSPIENLAPFVFRSLFIPKTLFGAVSGVGFPFKQNCTDVGLLAFLEGLQSRVWP